MDNSLEAMLAQVRESLANDQVEITRHFETQIAERALLWVDVLTIVEAPLLVEDQGLDDHGWMKYRIWGSAADGTAAAVVIVLRPDGTARFVTIHWEDK